MSIPKLSDLREPPAVGKFYLVPVVRAYGYANLYRDLPVIGPAHTDVEHFNFPHRHYHIDARFLTKMERDAIGRGYFHDADHHYTVGAMPLTNLAEGGIKPGRPKLARRRCSSNAAVYRHDDKQSVQALREHFGTPDAISLPDGRKLCPHRKADLTQFRPDADGFVLCPLHGLLVRCANTAAGVQS